MKTSKAKKDKNELPFPDKVPKTLGVTWQTPPKENFPSDSAQNGNSKNVPPTI